MYSKRIKSKQNINNVKLLLYTNLQLKDFKKSPYIHKLNKSKG